MSKATDTSFDTTAKKFYSKLFKRWGIHAETECEIFKHSRKIDLVVTCTDKEKQKLQDSVFAYFRELNAIELKGYNDGLNVKDFNTIMMRAWGLGTLDFRRQENKATPSRLPSQRTLTIICVRRPRKILDDLKPEFQFEATAESGIYRLKSLLDIWLIHPTELQICEKNYSLLTLARGQKLAAFLELCLREGLTEYLQLIYRLGFTSDPNVILRKIMEAYEMRDVIHEDTWPFVSDFFRKEPEAMDKIQPIQEAFLEREKKGHIAEKQNTLIRLLTLKFKHIPEPIKQTIQRVEDPVRLDHWQEQVLFAETLEAIDFSKTIKFL